MKQPLPWPSYNDDNVNHHNEFYVIDFKTIMPIIMIRMKYYMLTRKMSGEEHVAELFFEALSGTQCTVTAQIYTHSLIKRT